MAFFSDEILGLERTEYTNAGRKEWKVEAFTFRPTQWKYVNPRTVLDLISFPLHFLGRSTRVIGGSLRVHAQRYAPVRGQELQVERVVVCAVVQASPSPRSPLSETRIRSLEGGTSEHDTATLDGYSPANERNNGLRHSSC